MMNISRNALVSGEEYTSSRPSQAGFSSPASAQQGLFRRSPRTAAVRKGLPWMTIHTIGVFNRDSRLENLVHIVRLVQMTQC